MSPNQRHIVNDNEINLRRKIAELNKWSISFFIDQHGNSTSHADSTHYAEAISNSNYDFLVRTIAELDRTIGVDLKIINNENNADIIYAHHSYDVTYEDLAGVNSYSYTYTGSLNAPSNAEWIYNDISVNTNDQDRWAYIALHEIGHSLGLEHPFDSNDGDIYGGTYTATADETLMAYGYPADGVYPDFYTSLDVNALQEIWGSPGSGKKMTGDGSVNYLIGDSGEVANDVFYGLGGDDTLVAYRGADSLYGGNGNDELRAGNGRDIITGGAGGDTMYGGFGLNTFEDEADRAVDNLYLKSDQWAVNWLYGKAGNSPNGEKADKIVELDEFDEIYIQGVTTSQLSCGFVNHDSRLGETLSGIGIYASGYLEAVYVGDNLNLGQIAAMTQGVL